MKWGFKTCGPNQVLVVSGCCYPRPLLVPGGRVFVWPAFQKVQYLTLNVMNVHLESADVLSIQGIPVTVISTAQVKIGNEKKSLRRACHIFVGMVENEMIAWFHDALEGHQRTVIGKMTVEDIYFKRMYFASEVMKSCEEDLIKMGLEIIGFQVKQVKEKDGVIDNILLERSAKVKSVLRIEEAETNRDAEVFLIQKEEEFNLKVAKISQELMCKEKNLELQKISNDIENGAASAIVDLAPQIQGVMCLKQLAQDQMENKHLEADIVLERQKRELMMAETDATIEILETDALLDSAIEMSDAHNQKNVANAQLEAAIVRLQTTIHDISAKDERPNQLKNFSLDLVKENESEEEIDRSELVTPTNANIDYLTEQENKRLLADQDDDIEADMEEDNDRFSLSSSESGNPSIATVTLADAREDLGDIASHVKEKVSQVVGVDITNVIVKTVFQEVVGLLK